MIIAHYIPSTDLCAASLVCRKWYEIFEPFLWGAPASHFGTDNDAVYGKENKSPYPGMRNSFDDADQI